MSFYGTSMIFDGIACEEMGLVLYDFTNNKQTETSFASDLSVAEDRIGGRYRSLFYGGTINSPLTFTMVLCASEDRAHRGESFDRWDLQKIASWLTGHDSYKWLYIVQPDLADVRFRCICSELQTVEVSGYKWGFSCKVTCDSPFGYLLPRNYFFTVETDDASEEVIFSESTHNGLYYPEIEITNIESQECSIEIRNGIETSVFRFKNLPTSISTIRIDCENGVIASPEVANLYQYVDFDATPFHFPRLARGNNELVLTGRASYVFRCEWPVNVGG